MLAIGGALSPEWLLEAYRHGIFPWFDSDQPILWWSPDPRCILFPDKFKCSRSLKKSLQNKGFELRIDTSFDEVIEACSAPRPSQGGTWITHEMKQAYRDLHSLGHAHSYEIWQEDILAGGLYGIRLGGVFAGESMFSRVADSSKAALFYLSKEPGIRLIDCQIDNPHLSSLGAENISRSKFLQLLQAYQQAVP